MKTLFVSTLLLTSAIASAAPSVVPIKPFRAEYAAMRDGKPLGETTIEWRANVDGTYTLKSSTKGTSGLAKLAGLDVTEESTMRWRDGVPETMRYDFQQDAAFSSKERHADIDWEDNQVDMKDNNKRASYDTVPGMIDRHAVVLALANDLARGHESFDYKVAMKDGIEDFRYEKLPNATLKVPAGRYDTVALERKRGPRTSTTWFSEKDGWVPVQIEQFNANKKETITLQLKSLKR
ncbi:MAG: DUF3108 domain-containing protein [Dokdonella sp.]